MAKLSEIFDLQMGKTPARANPGYWNGGINSWISIADLSNCEKYVGETKEQITDIAIQESGIKKVPPNTVIMSFKLSLGKTAITKEATYTNEAIMAFIPKGNYEVSPDYFFYMLSGRDWSKGTNRAVMGVTLNKATLGEIDVIIPPFDKQCQVAAVLDKVGDLISLRKQQLTKLDEAVKARFIEMFGDPRLDDRRYSKSSLGSLAEVGSSKRIFEKEYVDEGVPFYRTKEIVELSKGNCITTELFISKDRYKEIRDEYGVPQKGDLLISAVGTIGVIWIVDGQKEFYFKDGNLLRVAATEKFAPIYLKYLLEALISIYKQKMSSGTAYAALTISELKELPVYEVPISEQYHFATFVEQVDKSKLTIQQSLDKLEVLKKSLMQQYFE